MSSSGPISNFDTAEPAEEFLDRLASRLSEVGSTVAADTALSLDTVVSEVVNELLSYDPGHIRQVQDAYQALTLATFLGRGKVDAGRLWAWASQVAGSQPGSGAVLSQWAGLGDQLRHKAGTTVQLETSQLAEIFNRAEALGADDASVFARAGIFHLNQNQDAEAERCFARSFKLDSTNAFVALQLAELMQRRDDHTAALATLDECIQQQADPHPGLLWKAGLAAVALQNWPAVLEYLGPLAVLEPQRHWVGYYQAIAFLETGHLPAARIALNHEASLVHIPNALHILTVRSAIAAGENDLPLLQNQLQAALSVSLGAVNYLPVEGILGCFTRLWRAVQKLPPQSALVQELQKRLLVSGLTPVDFWNQMRESLPKVKGLKHYWVDLLQPLDHRRATAGHALPGQDRWTAYRIRYGVLAFDESEASNVAMRWQKQSADLPASVIGVELEGRGFTDSPGVTRRSQPQPADGNAQPPLAPGSARG